MSLKQKAVVTVSSLALAAGAVVGVATPASAVYVTQGPYTAAAACNADRTHFVNYYPDFQIGSCFRWGGGWWFTV